MKKLCLILLVLLVGSLYSQAPYGSYGLIHTQSAKTFESGRLELFTNMNFFTKATDYVGAGSTPVNFAATNYWLIAGQFALTYGITDHFDVTLAPQIYQDTHYANEYNLPGDIFLTLKGGSFDLASRQLYGALMTKFRFPTGEKHNYPFAEYASGAVEYGFSGALSYYTDPYLPNRAFNGHLNIGWWNHNEAGQTFTWDGGLERKATKNSSKLNYNLGLVYPTGLFDFMLELHGLTYLTQPDSFIYSRDDYMYVTPGVRYKPLNWLSVDFGIDIKVSSDKFSTVGVPGLGREEYNLPQYAAWKVEMGVNIKILPFTPSRKTAAEVERDEFNKRVEFFEKIVEERERSEDVQEELDRLKEEREAAERELEELKQILEEEGN